MRRGSEAEMLEHGTGGEEATGSTELLETRCAARWERDGAALRKKGAMKAGNFAGRGVVKRNPPVAQGLRVGTAVNAGAELLWLEE